MIPLERVRPILEGELGAVSAAHPLAVSAGIAALMEGGTAVDAAIAAQAVLCVIMPEACGLGGDLLALVGEKDGQVTAVNGTGCTAATTPPGAQVSDGGASVTVPGLVDGWGKLSSRWGRLPLTATLRRARTLARFGSRVLDPTVDAANAQRLRLLQGGAADWPIIGASRGQHVPQPELADLLDGIGIHGVRWFYEGNPAAAVVRAVQLNGGYLELSDFADHDTPVLSPLWVPFAGAQVAVQPPITQGILLVMALAWLDRQNISPDPYLLDHLNIEITEAVFAHRHRAGLGTELLGEVLEIDHSRARHLGGPRSYLHTAGVATADSNGMVVSSLVSVFDDFGSATYVPELGITLNNRGGGFTTSPNEVGAGKRPVHTLAPSILVDGDRMVALATPGADGQIQTLLQVLVAHRLLGLDLATSVAAPRWRSQDGAVLIENAHPSVNFLAERGHRLVQHKTGDPMFGAVVVAGVSAGIPYAGSDWRRQVWSAAA